MNIRQQYEIERIIMETYNKNKDKSFNEIKKMIKLRIGLEISEEVASKYGTEKIMEIITNYKKNEEKKQQPPAKKIKIIYKQGEKEDYGL